MSKTIALEAARQSIGPHANIHLFAVAVALGIVFG